MNFLTTLVLTLAFSLTASAKVKFSPLPVRSTETIEFTSKSDQKFIDFAKNDEFLGVITRTGEKGSLRIVDLYSFPDQKAVPMEKSLCETLVGKIFGSLNKISLKSKIDIYESHTGRTCEAQLTDPDKEAKVPERRVIVGFINAKAKAIVFRFTKKSTSSEQESVRKFWDTLR